MTTTNKGDFRNDNQSDPHAIFREWATSNRVKIHENIIARRIPGKGIGVVALAKIPANTNLVTVPTSAIITIDSPLILGNESLKSVLNNHDISVQGIVAAGLALNSRKAKGDFPEWSATWPTVEDFKDSMPCFGLEKSRTCYLPVQKILHEQISKFNADWTSVKSIIIDSGATELDYRYHWALVNSRCYYWEFAKTRKPPKGQKADRDDCLSLCPWADYFNHESEGCVCSVNRYGYVITADRDYDLGEEIVASYGAHCNDKLLIDYGFTPDRNKHEFIPLDIILMRHLEDSKISLLKDMNYFGAYSLYFNERGASEPEERLFHICFRTEVALSTILFSEHKVREFTAGNIDLSVRERDQLMILALEIIRELRLEIDEGIENVSTASGLGEIPAVIKLRWAQMADFVTRVIGEDDGFGNVRKRLKTR